MQEQLTQEEAQIVAELFTEFSTSNQEYIHQCSNILTKLNIYHRVEETLVEQCITFGSKSGEQVEPSHYEYNITTSPEDN